MENKANSQLDPKAIIETIRILSERIHERFPDSGLEQVSKSLLSTAQDLNAKILELDRPILWIRIVTYLLIALLLFGIIGLFFAAKLPEQFHFFEFIQVLESGMNDVVLVGIGIFFLVTFEERIKRSRALKSLHVLRSIAHVIDMHQLTKDPERLQPKLISTASSPKLPLDQFQLGRYLSYCSEMLSLVGKLAALYLQHLDDPTVLDSVDEIEGLTTGLSGKIWQKLNVLHSIKN